MACHSGAQRYLAWLLPGLLLAWLATVLALACNIGAATSDMLGSPHAFPQESQGAEWGLAVADAAVMNPARSPLGAAEFSGFRSESASSDDSDDRGDSVVPPVILCGISMFMVMRSTDQPAFMLMF